MAARTPTGRAVTDYEGTVPPAKGTGPKNLPKTSPAAVPTPRPKASRASNPRISPARASAGAGPPPRGAGSGIPKATSPMASTPKKKINKPKRAKIGSRPGRRLGKPRADFPSRI